MLLELLANIEGSLNSGSWLQGMEIGKLGHGSHLLVDAGVILHGATAQGIEPVVHTEVVGTVVGVVAHHGQLVALGQLGVGGTAQLWLQFVIAKTVLGQRIGAATLMGEFKNQMAI